MRIAAESVVPRLHVLSPCQSRQGLDWVDLLERLTLTPLASPVDARAGNKDIVHYGEATFTTNPLAVSRVYSGVVKDGSLV